MQPPGPIATDIVLLGAGAAHLEVLRRFALRPRPGIRLALVAPEQAMPGAGLLSSLIRGDRGAADACIDLARLAEAAGARLILAEAAGIDLAGRMLALTGRPPLSFDLLSADLHGESAMADGRDACIPVSPAGRLLVRLAELEAALPDGARLAIIGGAPAGCAAGDTTGPKRGDTARTHGNDTAAIELALALARRLRGRLRLVLVSEAPEPLAAAPPLARRTVRAALVDAGVELASAVRAEALTDGRLALSDGSFLPADLALWAGDTLAPAFLAESGLTCDTVGRVRVNAGQRSVSHSCIFAVGDCAAKSHDHAVGPLLHANLCRAAQGRRLKRSLRRWLPPQVALAMLDLGGGRAVAWSNGLAVSGESVWRCMNWLNRRRIRAFTPSVEPANHGLLRRAVLARRFRRVQVRRWLKPRDPPRMSENLTTRHRTEHPNEPGL